MTLLHAEQLSLKRGDNQILEGVSLTCPGGTLTGIIGPNGAGKTSLLRLLAGLDAPAHGAVSLDDRPLASLPARARARNISYLAQQDALAWPLETQMLVMLGRIPHRPDFAPPRADDRLAVLQALERCDALSFIGRAVTTLSAGERSRVLLARALAVKAPVLLADEPVAALDPRHQLAVMETLREEARRGAAVIVVLHDLSLAARYCDALILLDKGRLAQSGAPDDVLKSEALGRVFGVNFFRGTHEDKDYVIPWTQR